MQSIDCVHSFSSTRTQYEAGAKIIGLGTFFYQLHEIIEWTHLTLQAVLFAVSL